MNLQYFCLLALFFVTSNGEWFETTEIYHNGLQNIDDVDIPEYPTHGTLEFIAFGNVCIYLPSLLKLHYEIQICLKKWVTFWSIRIAI